MALNYFRANVEYSLFVFLFVMVHYFLMESIGVRIGDEVVDGIVLFVFLSGLVDYFK